jgi:two-component system response regulator VicR
MGKLVLIVDDEKNIVDILKFNLEREGFSTIEAYDGEEGLNKALKCDPDIILLDIMLPKMDGYTVCKNLRQTLSTPVLMLTARDEEIDKVLGLELGADDYVTKPFSTRELIARVKANLRRSANGSGAETNGKHPTGAVEAADLTLDLDKYEIRRNGKLIELTFREFELVKFLILQAGQIFSRETLLEKVWGYEYYGDVRTVDVTVHRVRTKLENDPAGPRYIRMKRNVGYYFDSEARSG